MNIAPATRSSQCMPRCTAPTRLAIHDAEGSLVTRPGAEPAPVALLLVDGNHLPPNLHVFSSSTGEIPCGKDFFRRTAGYFLYWYQNTSFVLPRQAPSSGTGRKDESRFRQQGEKISEFRRGEKYARPYSERVIRLFPGDGADLLLPGRKDA